MLENSFKYDNNKWLQIILCFKEFLNISKILVHKDFLRDIENGKYKLFNMLDGLKQYPMTDDSELIKKASNGMKVSIDMVTNIFNKQVGDVYGK